MTDQVQPAGGVVVPPLGPANPPPGTPPPPPGEEYKNMTPAQFAERIAAATAQGAKGVLKDLGVEKLEDAKTRIDEAKKRADAELTESQRHAARVKELEPKAASAERAENAVKGQLEAWEAAVPADKKALLDLAPATADPIARFEWFTKAHKAKLFDTATTQQPLASTRAGGAAPPGNPGGTPPKSPKLMTPAERAQAKAEAEAKLRAAQT